jgi:hypothetical protein
MTPKQFEYFVKCLMQVYGYNASNPISSLIGRGTTHQIDALGICKMTPTFSYPITLLAEAKYYRKGKIVGIEVIRNFYGVLTDIQQNLPNTFSVPQILGQNYKYGTSNIVGLIISTVGFSSYAQNFAFAHGIFLVTVNFVKKNNTLLFANFNGQPVIVHVPDKLKFENEILLIRGLKILKLKNKIKDLILINHPLKGSIQKVKVLSFKDEILESQEKPKEPNQIICYLYDIKIPELKTTLRTISNQKIKSDSLLTIEIPHIMTYLTVEIKINKNIS